MLATISIRRIIGAGLTAFLVASTAYFAIAAIDAQRNYRACAIGEPTRFKADLSQPGVTEAPFHQTGTLAHGETVLLQVIHGPEDLETALSELTGRIEIIDNAGDTLATVELFQPHQFFMPPPHKTKWAWRTSSGHPSTLAHTRSA